MKTAKQIYLEFSIQIINFKQLLLISYHFNWVFAVQSQWFLCLKDNFKVGCSWPLYVEGWVFLFGQVFCSIYYEKSKLHFQNIDSAHSSTFTASYRLSVITRHQSKFYINIGRILKAYQIHEIMIILKSLKASEHSVSLNILFFFFAVL